MTSIEKQILENLFDALDRLFDGDCKVIDLHALIYASSAAMENNPPPLSLQPYEEQLKAIIRSGKPEEVAREESLIVTNDLRDKLNELLPI